LATALSVPILVSACHPSGSQAVPSPSTSRVRAMAPNTGHVRRQARLRIAELAIDATAACAGSISRIRTLPGHTGSSLLNGRPPNTITTPSIMTTKVHMYNFPSDLHAAESGTSRKARNVSPSNNPCQGAQNVSNDDLADIGCKAKRVRPRSIIKIALISFVLASTPYGLATTLLSLVTNGGSLATTCAWLAVSLVIICVAAF
jgi:hypothetical protein